MTILQILNQIEATRSKKEKVAIMTQHKDNQDLRQFFRLCLHPQINFFQKKDLGHIKEDVVNTSLSDAMDYLYNFIANRMITGHEALNGIKAVISQMTTDDAEVVRRILKKKTGCGVDSSVNDVWPKLIPEHPNLLASPYSDKLAAALNWEKGAIIERKSDGLRISIHVKEDEVVIYSRAGNILDLHGRFDALIGTACVGRVFDAELMVLKSDGKYEDRKTGNGICSKAIKGTLSKEESLRMVAVSWDVLPEDVFFGGEKCAFGMADRFNLMKYLVGFDEVKPLIRPIEHEVVYSLEEAQVIYNKYRNAGEEGAMLKDPDVMWEDRRSKKILKMKAEEEMAGIVTAWKEGSGKYAGMLGALTITSGDGKIVCDVGSGFTDADRTNITSENSIGRVISVKYNSIIESRDSEIYSLFLPIFLEFREDKTKGDNILDL